MCNLQNQMFWSPSNKSLVYLYDPKSEITILAKYAFIGRDCSEVSAL